MNNYKRLTNKKELAKPRCYNCEHNFSGSLTCERYCVEGDYYDPRSELTRLCELEDKIENGELIPKEKINEILDYIESNITFLYKATKLTGQELLHCWAVMREAAEEMLDQAVGALTADEAHPSEPLDGKPRSLDNK